MTRLFVTLVVLVLVTLLFGGTHCEEFYLGSFRNAGSTQHSLSLLITRNETSSSQVSIETIDGVINSTVIPPQSSIEIPLPLTVSNYTQRAVYIQSSNTISITVLSSNGNSSDAYQIYPIPTTNIEEYSIYYAITPGTNEMYSSQVLLISTSNDSTVTIKPKHNMNISSDLQAVGDNLIMSVLAGTIYSVTLHRFQTLLLESFYDLTGSMITSNKPLVVISGHECAHFDTSLNCNYVAEQIPPVNVWGQQFTTFPFSVNSNQSYIIISSTNDTNITQTCSNGSIKDYISLPEAGQSYYTVSNYSDVLCSIQSNSPILIASIYMGDRPLMTLIPPIEQYGSSVSLASFTCTVTTTRTTLLLNGTNSVNISNDIIPISATSSVLYLSYEDTLYYSQQNNNVGAIVYNIESPCQYAYTVGWNLTQKVTVSPPPPQTVTMYVFGTTGRTVSEDDGTVEIVFTKTNNINEQTSVIVTTNYSDSNDFTILNELIVFDVGETRQTLRINITDDEWAEPQESFTLTLNSNGIQPIISGEITITIVDDDSLTVGLNSILYESITNLLSVEVGVNLGVLATNVNFGLIIKLQEWILLDQVNFTRQVTAHVIKVNLSQTDICSNKSAPLDCLVTSEIELPETTLNVILSPNQMNGTLHSFTATNENCDFLIGEFTRESLLIATCVSGTLLLLTILSIALGITGCGLSYHTRRKWTLGGGLNRLYFQDDAMSLATNDPESYELMNRLGEKKTAVLAINDDNEY